MHADRALLPSFPGYRTSGVVGYGGFGVVFEAERESGGPNVAIKLARSDKPDAGLRLLRETLALSEIGPPHVPVVYEIGELVEDSPYVVMEYVSAPTLAARLARQTSSFSLTEVAEFVSSILRALEAVHARGFVHRDLKPENIFVDEKLQTKLIDFGLVSKGAGVEGMALTTQGSILGTAEYMAPEQCEGRADIDASADIYALGVILYEMIAGHPPFWGVPAVVQQSHRGCRPPRLSGLVDVPPTIEEIVHRCLAKERRERFASASELRAALEGAVAEAALQELQARISMIDLPPSSGRISPVPSSARRERIRVGMILFQSEADPVVLSRQVVALGGKLAHAAGGQYVVAYSHHGGGDNPARRCMQAAEELLRQGVCERALVDVSPILVESKADGTRRFLSPTFARAERYPGPSDPAGLLLTPAASAMLPDVAVAPVLGRGWLRTGSNREESAGETVVPETFAGPLIGRDVVIAELFKSAREIIESGLPAVASVIAEAGHGKSHLFRVLLDRLRSLVRQGRIIELRGREQPSGGPEQTVGELLQQALDLPSIAPPDGGRALLRERLGVVRGSEMWPAVALALGWVTTDATELRALVAAPGALRHALTVATGEALRWLSLSLNAPVFVLLDDAHLADDVMLAALEYAALAEAGAPIWICAFGRPGFENARPSWGERAARRDVHRLGPLDPASAAALCRQLLFPVKNVPEPAVQHLIQRAQAIPLLMIELVRGLLREGIVRRHPKGDSWYLATDELDRLPDLSLIDWIAHSEIEALAPALRAHAHLTALLGAEVTIGEVTGVLRRLDQLGAGADFPLDARIGTERLLSAGVLIQHRHERLGFRHALVREAIVRSIPELLRTQIHLAAFEHYRDAEGASDDRRLLQTAFHAAQAGLDGIAEQAYLTLADRTRGRHAYVDAELLYTRAIELAPRPRLAAYRGRGLMRYRMGRYHDALTDLAQARRMAAERGDAVEEIEILLDEATVLDWMGEFRSSEERVEQAKARAPESRSSALNARLDLGIARSLHRFSREREAAELCERAAEEASRAGDEAYETRVISLVMLGFILQGLGRLDEAGRALDRAVELCEEHGDTLHLVSAVNNRALLRACLGDRAGMITDLMRVLALARELGQATVELVGQYNLGEYLYLMDDLDAAEPHIRRALAIDRRLTGDEGRPVVALLSARFRFYRGDEAAARAVLDRIDEREARSRAQGRMDALMVPSEEVLAAMVELAIRDGGPEEWEALLARSARYSVGQEHIEVLEMRAVSALRRGRVREALRGFEAAMAAAARIPNVMGERLARQHAACIALIQSGLP